MIALGLRFYQGYEIPGFVIDYYNIVASFASLRCDPYFLSVELPYDNPHGSDRNIR